ncbi:MAG: hypothetical protein ACXWE7_12460, partial [Nitrososphaeraceae archaeon]
MFRSRSALPVTDLSSAYSFYSSHLLWKVQWQADRASPPLQRQQYCKSASNESRSIYVAHCHG